MLNTRKILTLLFICALVTATLLVSGCTEAVDDAEDMNNEEIESETISIDDITDVKWQWSGLIENEPASQSVVPDPENYTILFSKEGTYSIKADCNLGSGSYTLEGNDLTLAPGPITLAYCGPDSLDNQYLSLLSNVTTVSLDNDQLVLGIGENGDRMLFVEEDIVSLDEIIDIEWQWSGLTETLPASQSVVPDPENYTLVFKSDGRYLIKADCNVGSGGYTLEGNDLTLAPGPMTRAYCGPDSLDNQYLSLLSNVTTVSMDNDQLVLGIGENGDRMLFVKGKAVEQ